MNLFNISTFDGRHKNLGGIGTGWCLLVKILRVTFGFAFWMPSHLFWHGFKNNTLSYFHADRREIQVRIFMIQCGIYLERKQP